ncbi:hypothetical protein [Bradyrhizobium sp. NBAIM01]|uniref:hypothetical protein n=1 Tax=Bradyrhizobium sp. NBAIM01 TaxID=2793818 RepID=UPI001CD340DF|nr:hypothetical protein [Bradyrhizobium sp. NBAIM01]
MRSLTDLLASLLGIMPIKTRRLVLEGELLSAAERSDIRSRDRSFLDLVLEVGSDVAAAILAAYKDGRLPMKRGAKPVGAPGAEAYLAQADELRTQITERERREREVKDPSLITESDLTNHRHIDSVFIANIGTGSGSIYRAQASDRLSKQCREKHGLRRSV